MFLKISYQLASLKKMLPILILRHVIGPSLEVYNSFLPQQALKLRAGESGSPEKVPGKDTFYYINYHNSGTLFGLTDSTACNFEAS